MFVVFVIIVIFFIKVNIPSVSRGSGTPMCVCAEGTMMS